MEQQQSTMVCVRLRPPSAKETSVRCIKADGDGKSVQFTSSADKSYSLYSYDAVFGELSCANSGQQHYGTNRL